MEIWLSNLRKKLGLNIDFGIRLFVYYISSSWSRYRCIYLGRMCRMGRDDNWGLIKVGVGEGNSSWLRIL